MKTSELVKLYPWVNQNTILPFADKLNIEQWKCIAQSELPDLLKTLDPLYVTAIFESFVLCSKEAGLNLSVVKAILDSVKIQLRTASFQFGVVFDWLGKVLIDRIERDGTTIQAFDDLMLLLSSEPTRLKLENFESKNPKFHGKDIRHLYLHHHIKLSEFIEMVKQASQLPEARIFPAWIQGVEGARLVNHFSDRQLTVVQQNVAEDVLLNSELCSSFLRTILAKTSICDQQRISECPYETFEEIVKDLYPTFYMVATKHTQFASKSIKEAADKGLLVQSVTLPTSNLTMKCRLIRKYLTKYKDAPIPPTEEKEALEAALRNAANVGNYWDVLSLLTIPTNPNAKGAASGKTALHFAVECANRTGLRLCFDLLANHAEIDFSITDDKQGKTALDSWDFKRFPDEGLLQTREASKKKKPSNLVALSSFRPESRAQADSESKGLGIGNGN